MQLRSSIQREDDIAFFLAHAGGGIATLGTSIPYSVVIDSGVPGPVVCAIGGVHGYEPAGVIALRDILEEFIKGGRILRRGVFIGIIGNPISYLYDVRLVNRNLNRLFYSHEVAGPYESMESYGIEGARRSELARFFRALPQLDACVDLHCVSNIEAFLTLYQSPVQREFVDQLSPLSWCLELPPSALPGCMIEDVARVWPRAKVCVIECGKQEDPVSVDVARYHIDALLHLTEQCGSQPALDLIPSRARKPELSKRHFVFHSKIPTAQGMHFVIPEFRSGTLVRAGEVYARSNEGEHRAAEDLYAMFPSRVPNPKDDDAGLWCTLTP